MFSGISRDGWIEDGSEIVLPDLFRRGNTLDIEFTSWRPAGLEPALIDIYLCGDRVSQVRVDKNFTHTVFLTGDCNPRVISFDVLNPFTPSATDQRELGAQIAKVSVSSKAGFPILKPQKILLVAFFIFVLALVLFEAASSYRIAAYLLPVLCYVFLASTFPYRIDKLLPVWFVALCFFAGLIYVADYSERKIFSAKEYNFTFYVAAVLITLAAAALRFYGLSFGLPENYHPDEIAKVNAVMRMKASGTLNPEYFLHPSLLLYSTYAFTAIFEHFGIIDNFQSGAFLAGRSVSALAGTLSVFFACLIGRRAFHKSAGLLGGLFFAFAPLHVASSRYLKEDSLLLFFSLIVVWLVLVAVQDTKPRRLLLAGLLAGFSASVKYSGLLNVGIVLSAPWLRSGSVVPAFEFVKWAFAGAVLSIPGFLLCTPYAVLDSEKFLSDFNYERKHMSRGHVLPITAWSQYWMYHLSRSLNYGMTLPVVALGMIGAGMTVVRRNWYGLFIIGLFLLYYLPAEFVKAKPAPQPERYVLPCVPFLALLAGEALRVFAVRRGNALLISSLIGVISLVTVSYRSITLASEIRVDTRVQMTEWVNENLPAGVTIYIDHRQYSPGLDEKKYHLLYAPRARIHSELDREVLRKKGVDYLMLSSLWYDRYYSQPRTDERVQNIIQNVFETFPLLHEVRPRYGTYGFHNPIVRLYRVR